jgi:hypothetical protein
MGTQQILLIVLSVIIVGIAVVVGIMMFNNQAYNANKQAVASENTTYGSLVVQWWKTPRSQGGAGQNAAAVDSVGAIAAYIGFKVNAEGENPALGLYNEDTGYFVITGTDSDPTTPTVTITGYGKDVKGGKSPKVETVVTLPNGTMDAQATDETNPYL